MKALIWIGCIFFAAILMVIIQNAAGVTLGPLVKTIIVGSAFGIAIALCKKCNKPQDNREDSQLDNPPDENDEP